MACLGRAAKGLAEWLAKWEGRLTPRGPVRRKALEAEVMGELLAMGPKREAAGGVPVTQIYGALQGGDPDALARLWPLYFRRLAALAEKKIKGLKSTASDGEDLALNALQSFHRRATRGDFQIGDRDDLWRQLVALTHQKAVDLIRLENRAKRGGGQVVRAGDVEGDEEGTGVLEAAAGGEPDPALLAEVAENCRILMEKLGEGPEGDVLRRVAQLRMELNSGKEIAQILGTSESSIDRKLRMVREIWARTESPE